MDKENRFKLGIPRFFKSTYTSCRSRILSDTTTAAAAPIIPPSSKISSTSFRSVSKHTDPASSRYSNSHAPFFYNPQFTSTASPVSSLILDREFYHRPKSKKQNKTNNKKKKMSNSKRTFSSRSRRLAAFEIDSSSRSRRLAAFEIDSSSNDDDDNNDTDDDDVFFSSRSIRSSSDSSNDTTDSVVAVVKRSIDPYEDFRTSMVEMIVEKQILNGRDLEMLLQSFLELNSRHHHRVILNVFVEILEALFGQCD